MLQTHFTQSAVPESVLQWGNELEMSQLSSWAVEVDDLLQIRGTRET